MNLHLAGDCSLPSDAVTETFGLLAKRGSGKSYTAMKMAEEMLLQNRQIVAIDPTSSWWGLRASSDGKGPGFPILILGGERGDVPLEETGGRVVAELAAHQSVSMVIDLNLLSKGAMIRFMTEFSRYFYEMKAPDQYRNPVHMFIDEADLFAPQRPMHGQEQLLGSMEDIVRRGRTRGLGVSLITQRSAVLNKNVLTQAETLILMRMTSPQDIGAVEDWIQYHQVKHEAETVIQSLPSLPRGDAWIWSPGWPSSS